MLIENIDKYFNAYVYLYYIGKEYFPFLRTYDIIKNPEDEIFQPINKAIKDSVNSYKKKTKNWILNNWILNNDFKKKTLFNVKNYSKILTNKKDVILVNFDEFSSCKSAKKSTTSTWNPYKFSDANSWTLSDHDFLSQVSNEEKADRMYSYKELKTSSLIKYLKVLLEKHKEESLKVKQDVVKSLQRPYLDLLENSESSVQTLHSIFDEDYWFSPSFKYVKDVRDNYDFYKSKVCPILSELIYVGALEWDNKLQESLQKQKNNEEEDLCCICNINCSEDDNLLIYWEVCNLPFHQKWFGVRVVPKGNWEWYLCKAFGKKYNKCVKCFLCPISSKAGLVPTNIVNDKDIDRRELANNWAEIESSSARNKYFNKIKLRKTLNQIVTEESENVAKLKDNFKSPLYKWVHAACGQLMPECKKSLNMTLGLAELDINRCLTKCDIWNTQNGAAISWSNGNTIA